MRPWYTSCYKKKDVSFPAQLNNRKKYKFPAFTLHYTLLISNGADVRSFRLLLYFVIYSTSTFSNKWSNHIFRESSGFEHALIAVFYPRHTALMGCPVSLLHHSNLLYSDRTLCYGLILYLLYGCWFWLRHRWLTSGLPHLDTLVVILSHLDFIATAYAVLKISREDSPLEMKRPFPNQFHDRLRRQCYDFSLFDPFSYMGGRYWTGCLQHKSSFLEMRCTKSRRTSLLISKFRNARRHWCLVK